MLKFDNKNTSSGDFIVNLEYYFTPFSSVSIANIEQVNVSWV